MIWVAIGGVMFGFLVGFFICAALSISRENEYIIYLKNKKQHGDKQ